MSERGIIFRRINGRVVPLRSPGEPKRKHEVAAGGGLVGAGVAAALATGRVAGNMSLDAWGYASVAKKFDASADALLKSDRLNASMRSHRLARKFVRASDRMNVMARNTKRAGFVVSSSLIGAGLNKLLKQTKLKDDETTRTAISTGAAGASYFALQSTFLKRHGYSTLAALKKAAKGAARFARIGL